MIDLAGQALTPEERTRLCAPQVGGVILFSRNYKDPDQVRDLVADIHRVRTPPLLVAVDQEGGRVQRFRDGFTRLPPLRWLGQQYGVDPAKARRLARLGGWLMAAELLDLGVDLSFAPVVDLDWGLSEVIGDRALHRDPDIVSALATAYMQGMRRAGMAAVAKHFPGHGGVRADSHIELPEDQRGYEDLQEDLLPYRRLIDQGLPGIMVAHVRYPNIDRQIASFSSYWLRTELRSRLGFSGAIFSDDLTMRAAEVAGDMTARVRQTLAAGADIALICNDPDAVGQVLEEFREDSSPASHGRLAALRPAALQWKPGALRDTGSWQEAVVSLREAQEPPPLTLDG